MINALGQTCDIYGRLPRARGVKGANSSRRNRPPATRPSRRPASRPPGRPADRLADQPADQAQAAKPSVAGLRPCRWAPRPCANDRGDPCRIPAKHDDWNASCEESVRHTMRIGSAVEAGVCGIAISIPQLHAKMADCPAPEASASRRRLVREVDPCERERART